MSAFDPTAPGNGIDDEEWPWYVVFIARVVGWAFMSAAIYGVLHLGFIAFGHSHHGYKWPLCISFALAALVMWRLWWSRKWQDLFENMAWETVFFVLLGLIPITIIAHI